MCVQCREGSIKHAASHFSVAVVQSIRDKKEEERGDLWLFQVLRQLIQSQSNATSEIVGYSSIRRNALIKPIYWSISILNIRNIRLYLASHWSGGASETTLPRASSTGGGLYNNKKGHTLVSEVLDCLVIWSACSSHIEFVVVELSELAEDSGRLLSVMGHSSW